MRHWLHVPALQLPRHGQSQHQWREIRMRLPCDRRSVGLQDASAHGIIDAHTDADH
jgi:hypothetical protein